MIGVYIKYSPVTEEDSPKEAIKRAVEEFGRATDEMIGESMLDETEHKVTALANKCLRQINRQLERLCISGRLRININRNIFTRSYEVNFIADNPKEFARQLRERGIECL